MAFPRFRKRSVGEDSASKDVAAELVWSIVDHLSKPPPKNWVALATVLQLRGRSVRGSYGYLYLPDGDFGSGTTNCDEIESEVEAYLTDVLGPDAAWPVKLLVQFDRITGNFRVTFEDTDESRWAVAMDRIMELREELRPNFDNEP